MLYRLGRQVHPYIRIFLIVHITTFLVAMPGKRGGENTKKAVGNAKVRPLVVLVLASADFHLVQKTPFN